MGNSSTPNRAAAGTTTAQAAEGTTTNITHMEVRGTEAVGTTLGTEVVDTTPGTDPVDTTPPTEVAVMTPTGPMTHTANMIHTRTTAPLGASAAICVKPAQDPNLPTV